jgi:hypothetical protein
MTLSFHCEILVERFPLAWRRDGLSGKAAILRPLCGFVPRDRNSRG